MCNYVLNSFRFTIILVLALSFNFTFGQVNKNVKFSVSYQIPDPTHQEQGELAKKILTDALQKQGGIYSEHEGYLFFINLSEPNKDGKVALSITTFLKAPEELVQSGINDEVFHKATASTQPESLREEEKQIRRYINKEYMRQFVMMYDSYIEIIEKEQLPKAIQSFASDY